QEASDSTLWVGGDFTHARLPNTNNRWTGAFVRFAARDVAPPATPAGLTVGNTGSADTLTWQPVPGASTYEVLRADRVIAVTSGSTAQFSDGGAGSRYFVRAVDAAGNRSATTAVVIAPEPDEEPEQPVDVLTA